MHRAPTNNQYVQWGLLGAGGAVCPPSLQQCLSFVKSLPTLKTLWMDKQSLTWLHPQPKEWANLALQELGTQNFFVNLHWFCSVRYLLVQ